jgi:hypothetical protein
MRTAKGQGSYIKLDWETAQDIRAAHDLGFACSMLANEYGIKAGAVRDIIAMRTYKSVPSPAATHKVCRDCGVSKAIDEFRTNSKTTNYRRPECRVCQNQQTVMYHKRRVAEDPDGYAAHRDAVTHRSWLKQKYGITPEDYETMLINQSYACAICQERETHRKGSSRFAVDHDHITGEVRGLLCDGCNVGLGRFKDDPMLLQSATQYLTNHLADQVMTY